MGRFRQLLQCARLLDRHCVLVRAWLDLDTYVRISSVYVQAIACVDFSFVRQTPTPLRTHQRSRVSSALPYMAPCSNSTSKQ